MLSHRGVVTTLERMCEVREDDAAAVICAVVCAVVVGWGWVWRVGDLLHPISSQVPPDLPWSPQGTGSLRALTVAQARNA